MPLQDWIHHWEEGAGANLLKVAAGILGFLVLAGLYDALASQDFSSEEAMESAQLARNIARGQGYTTQCIRPLSVYLLRKQAPPGQGANVLRQPTPDLTTPPAYPLLLAGVMRLLPFDFVAGENQYWYFAPDRWITVFNQVLFFVAVLLLFRIARRLFDSRVAWLSATLFAGSNLFWNFTSSGLSVLWLTALFLGAVLCLVHLQEREQAGRGAFASLSLAAGAGVLIGLAGLSRYAFTWMLLPVLLFIGWAAPRRRRGLCAAAAAAVLIVMAPWIARNLQASGTCFGTATFAVLEQTPPFEQDTLERSFDPAGGFRRIGPLDLVDKFLSNARAMWRNELPRLGGNWISAFFLVGLLVPFRNPALGRMRLFLLCSLGLLFVVQAVGRTHLSSDNPEINSENLLALLAPLVIVFGVALFYTLIDPLPLLTVDARGALIAAFVAIMCAPFLATLLLGRALNPDSPYSPLHIQRVARLFRPKELILCDIPAAVAWYGDRPCGWLPLDDDREFYQFNSLKRVNGLFLTQRTTNGRFLTQMMRDPKSWGHFVEQVEAHGEVPTGFPLRKAPSPSQPGQGLLPDEVLLSDQARWRLAP